MSLDWDKLVLGPAMGIFGENGEGQLPTFTPRGLAPFALRDAVFDDQFLIVTVNDDGTQTTSTQPCLGVRNSLFERPPAQNDRVAVPATGKTYLVSDVQPDGHGHSRLMLMEAA
ncbi:MAG TPA: hypothetical protein VF503_09260 [Sphingobium sp.]|uniref:head-tail joining protein n=1 Tax=Sphingobium sp. TaxID=1912891 RepID=UPI002ED3E063